VIWATEPITSLNESTSVREPSSRDLTCVYAWSIWVANYSRVDLTSDDLWSQAPPSISRVVCRNARRPASVDR
jgi:hypothetical protein